MNIPGYRIEQKLHVGKNFTVYQAAGENNGAPWVLKTLDKKAAPNLHTIKALSREYHLLKQIDSNYVIKAVDWIEENEYAAIVLEDINGIPIKNEIKKPLPMEQFIHLAIQITTGLKAIHEQNIIHKDINPTNIIYNSQTGSLKLIDFSIASTFDIKVSYTGNPEMLQGTLPYISPEQTGRMNRRVDQRSDLYSLGVTFYEMLTGKLPFEQRDPMELIYAHLARNPEPPHLVNAQIPPIISKIILKLLAKNPEERCQSAVGLLHDLQKAAQSNFNDFTLGEKDFTGKLQVPEKLYGREKEIDQLLGTYRDVCTGKKMMILVTGYSGTGKTALVNEIHKHISKDRGYFSSGKFDQLQRSTPYFAFIQALNQLCRMLLAEPQEILTQWQEHILQSLGKLGKVLTDIIPLLESIIGKQPDVPEVGGDEAKKRFNYVFQCFLQAVCSKEHPLVLFLDDLQWADLASLNLLQVLMEDRQNRYLLFIGAYRDNEVSPLHPLLMTLEDIQKQDIGIQTIPVKNLTAENVREWLLDTLKIQNDVDLENEAALSGLIYQKTQGNAFFTIQFLESIYRDKLLRFDFSRAQWTWDIPAIKKQNITDNVVDLLVRKIKTLPAEVQEVLKVAACIGNVFDLNVLSVISGRPKEEHERILETAIADQLLYQWGDEDYKFVHDRIHQAAYTLIADEDKKPLHLEIGRMLLKTFAILDKSKVSQGPDKHIFDIVNHFNTGIDLIENEQEKIQLAGLNLEAGQMARKSTAYKSGADYIRTAAHLLPPDCWEKQYDLTLAVYNEAVQTYYLCGNFADMDHFIDKVLMHAHDISHTSLSYEYRLLSLLAQNQAQLAVETMLQIFKRLGVDIPRTPNQSETNQILGKTQALLDQVSLTNLPMMSDPGKKLVLRLFYVGAVAFLFTANELWPFIISTMTCVILEFGLIAETPYILACYGIIKILMGDIPGAYRLGENVMDLLKNGIGNEAIKVRSVPLVCFYIYGQKQHFKTVCKLLMEYYHYALNVGDFEYAAYNLAHYNLCLSRTDTELSIVNEKALANRESVIQLRQPLTIPPILIEISSSANLLGQTPNPAVFQLDDIFRDLDPGSEKIYRWQLNLKQIILSYLFEEYTHILDHIKVVEENLKFLTVPLTYIVSDCHFYISLAYLQLHTKTSTEQEKLAYLDKAIEKINIMKQWAEFGPVNFLHKYYLMQAELCRVTDKGREAAEYYDKAIEKAYENEYVNEAALANELAAKFYMQQNRHKLAAHYFLEARDCYRKWGAIAKVKQLEENYPKYLSKGFPAAKRTVTGTISSISTDTTDEFLDITSIIKASLTLSSEVQLARLLEKMMHILIENAGAQKSIFIENIDQRLLIQAEGTADGVTGILQAQPVEESGNLPLTVINYVARSEKTVVCDNISKDPNYSPDMFIKKHQPKSVGCFPIIRKEKLSAVIYLENNLVEGAFTPERIKVLNTLAAQIAISLENARIYGELEDLNKRLEQKVEDRTKEIAEKNLVLEQQSQQLKELDKLKSRFFANISHEFRTPLTLIMGPLEKMLAACSQNQQARDLKLMLRNSQRLLSLINQLLDLSKFDSGTMKLQACRQNVVPFLKGIFNSFDSLAEQNDQALTFHAAADEIILYFDPPRLEEIIVNLLSNALKFTPAGGQITMTVGVTNSAAAGDFFEISIRDTGPGIPEDQLSHIFDRFYQADSTFEHHHKGSGIGLSIAKEIVELHHGTISAHGIRGGSGEPGGAEFVVRLPMGDAHLKPGEIVEKTSISWKLPDEASEAPEINKTTETPGGRRKITGLYMPDFADTGENPKPIPDAEQSTANAGAGKNIVLVVEDSVDMRLYIRGALEPLYTVVEANDGQQGLQKAREIIPDLIICDVMMPIMNGYEVCRTLKADVAVSHIPIILLTAKAGEESILAGLESGADDYITKPFSTKILCARIKNLIELRCHLQETLKREMTLQPVNIKVSTVDEEFLKDLYKVLSKNIADGDFNVEDLSRKLYMNRVTLYRKINALAGENPTDFIRSYRLKRGAELLKNTDKSVLEVALDVGFSSSSYFIKCFKEKFHQLPSEYQRAEKMKNMEQ
jgi:predicted ATPase/signal transduction histidine kinase/DNA-binding NarL/FixJ family response regulator